MPIATNSASVAKATGINVSRRDEPGYRCIQPETKPAKPGKDLTALKEFFARAFRQITNKDIAWPFLEPVDEEAAMAPNYYDVIKEPMDFGTLRKRYRNRWYESVHQFLHDYRLIYSNCYRFNDPSTEIHGMCRELEQFGENLIKPVEKAAEDEKQQDAKVPTVVGVADKVESAPVKKTPTPKKPKPAIETIKASPSNLEKSAKTEHKLSKAKSPKKSITDQTSAKPVLKQAHEKLNNDVDSNISKKRERVASISPTKVHPSKQPKLDTTPQNVKDNQLEPENVAPDADLILESIRNDIEEHSNQLKQVFFDPNVMQNQRPVPAFTPQIMTDCQNILDELKTAEHNHVIWPFIKTPPNADYPDLTFVETSMKNGRFQSVEAFATAVRHVFMHILTNFNSSSEINNMAKNALDIFDHVYSKYLNKNLALIRNRTHALSSQNQKIDEVYKFLMEDVEIQKNIGMNDRKILQIDKRYSELEKQFNIYRSQSTQTIDKLRKRISYLKSKQQSDLVYINEKFQTAVKSAAQFAGTGSFNGQTLPQTAPLQSKNVKNKLNKYYQSKTIAPLKEMDKLEQTSRSIMLAGVSKSDDEEESERVLSHDERRKLSYDIDRLSQKMLHQLIEQITIWENLDPTQVSEFVIDYDNMKPNTLRKVTQFVSSCVKRLPRQKQIQGIPVTDPHHPNYSVSNTAIKTEETESALDSTEQTGTKQTEDLSASSDGEQLQIEENEVIRPDDPSTPQNSHQSGIDLANNSAKKNFIHIKKSLDHTQLVSALHALEKDKSEAPNSTPIKQIMTNQNNAFVHLIPGNNSMQIGSPVLSQGVAATTTPNTSAWSNFGENLKDSAVEAKALESVVGTDYAFQAAPDKRSENNSPNPENLQVRTSPNDTNPALNVPSQTISSPASSSSGANKELLKAEAKKKRAANIDKNETIEQRELITSYEEGAMMR